MKGKILGVLTIAHIMEGSWVLGEVDIVIYLIAQASTLCANAKVLPFGDSVESWAPL